MFNTKGIFCKFVIAAALLTGACVGVDKQAPGWQWAERIGVTEIYWSSGIAVDNNGNCYVTGHFIGTATFGEIELESAGRSDIFVAKMDNKGNWLWAKRAGGEWDSRGDGIAVDNKGNIYVTGCFWEIVAFGETELQSAGYYDIFVAKLDSAGNWIWAERADGKGSNLSQSIALDKKGNSYVTGWFSGILRFGETELEGAGETDIFVAKLDTEGNWLWAKRAGGTMTDCGLGITVDNNGNSYLTGSFTEKAVFGETELHSAEVPAIFIAKLDSEGIWLWAKSTGGEEGNMGRGIALDDKENLYLTGFYTGTTTFGKTELQSAGGRDIFVAKMDGEGNWIWAERAGGTGINEAYSIAVDKNGNGFVTGVFRETAAFGETELQTTGTQNIFVAKIDNNGNWLWAEGAQGEMVFGNGIAIDSNGYSFVIGSFGGLALFGEIELQSAGKLDNFVAKIGQ